LQSNFSKTIKLLGLALFIMEAIIKKVGKLMSKISHFGEYIKEKRNLEKNKGVRSQHLT